MIKALSLISGGLDSILAALMVKKQGVRVQGLAFRSLFFNPNLPNLPLITKDISLEHLKIVKNPKYGYGKRSNPCIDCHLLMLKKAKKIMEEKGYHFIITGEVLGQRPFSQSKNALNLIEKQAGLKGLILRPLSAKLLPSTIPEKKGWIKREKLLGISGRSRKIQLNLAKKYNLKNFSTPGTSCILTDPQFSQRLFKMIKKNPKCNSNDINLLKIGRHFWHPKRSVLYKDGPLKGRTLIIVGRNHQENLRLKKIAQKKDILIEPKIFPGPTILARTYCQTPITPISLISLFKKYSPKAPKKLSQKDFKITTETVE